MNRQLLFAGILGGVAMYLWTFIAHMFLPLGEAGISQIENEQALLAQMKSTLGGHGLYMFPRMAPGEDQNRYQQSIASGPSGLLLYFPRRDFNFGTSLAIEFGSELLQALIITWLLSLTRLATFTGRVGFFAIAGIAVVVSTNLSYWNWYGFPTAYTAAYMFTGWMAYVCAGSVVAALTAREMRRLAATA
jgi:hypothetical protein